ncbi:MAG: hypothetical protein VX670_11135, partial [Candidatus Latescibacterota bacterium]|nr:hypothetical protein [Candidatus Latescibacterota bacterium]
ALVHGGRAPLRPDRRLGVGQHALPGRARLAVALQGVGRRRAQPRRLLLGQHLAQDADQVLQRDGLQEEGRDAAAARLAADAPPGDGPRRRQRAHPLPGVLPGAARGAAWAAEWAAAWEVPPPARSARSGAELLGAGCGAEEGGPLPARESRLAFLERQRRADVEGVAILPFIARSRVSGIREQVTSDSVSKLEM